MDFLQAGLELLSDPEQKGFRQYLSKSKNAKRALQLFDLILKKPDWDGPTMAAKIYQPANLNAYHSLRKSLLQQLEEYIAIQDLTQSNSPRHTLTMARFFIENNGATYATKYLLKAAGIAEKNGDYNGLSDIYQLLIQQSHQLEIDPASYFEPWKKAQEKVVLQQQLTIAHSLIRKRLSEARLEGTTLNPDDITEEVFNIINLRTEDSYVPTFMLEVVQMIRSAVISSKDYSRFEGFILRVYKRLDQNNAFDGKEQMRSKFLYMISHTLYRNRKLEEASKYLQQLSQYKSLREKYIQLQAAVLSYRGKNEESIELLLNELEKNKARLPLADTLNMRLNLVVYYFQSAQYRSAIQAMRKIEYSDQWLEKKMGKEWRFKRSMIEVIVLYELGHSDLASNRIEALEKYFSTFFQHPAYKRAQFFLKFIKMLLANPEKATTPEFAKEVELANMAWPDNKEDTQAITFFCWLKSKMIRRPYYEVLIEAVNSRQ